MRGKYSKFITATHFLGDISILTFSFFMGFYLRWGTWDNVFDRESIIVLVLVIFTWTFSVHLLRVLDISRLTQIDRIISKTFRAILLNILMVFTLIVALKAYDLSRKWLLIMFSLFYSLVIVWRIVFYKIIKWYRQKGYNYRRVAIIGAGAVGQEMYDFFSSDKSYGFKCIGFFDDNPNACDPNLYLGKVSDVKQFKKENKLDELYCSLPDYAHRKIVDLTKICDESMIRFKIIPDYRKFSGRRITMDFYGSIPVMHQRSEPLQSLSNRIKKRIFDIVFSLGVILFVFPILLPVIGLLIKLTSKGPIFFVQERTGIDNKTFRCFKFRTMTVNKDSDLVQAKRGDARITKIGAFLRKTNLDEFPQFINVLIGDMSVVGPRPHMLKHTEEYSKLIEEFMVRHFCKPGITGWAQVNGYRGETKTTAQMRKRVLFDIWYLERWSFFLDLRIVFLTLKNMIKGEDNAF